MTGLEPPPLLCVCPKKKPDTVDPVLELDMDQCKEWKAPCQTYGSGTTIGSPSEFFRKPWLAATDFV